MSTPPTPPGWRVSSLTVHFGGSIEVAVNSPSGTIWHVSVTRDGDWLITSLTGDLPDNPTRSAIMATVSAYCIRRTFGDNTR